MCLFPKFIRSKTRYIPCDCSSSPIIKVPCGQCYECVELKRNEFYFRSYYEAMSTFDKGGFYLFDTLTYDENHLPHLSDFYPDLVHTSVDFPCFNTTHTTNFFHNLRTNLVRAGFKPAHCLKYFLTTEYGDDDRYTHRPHIHIILYSTVEGLSPLELSSLISKSWCYGRTDGLPFQPAGYVLRHVGGYMGLLSPSDDLSIRYISSYVSKYVTKDSRFMKVIDERFNYVLSYLRKTAHNVDGEAKYIFNGQLYDIDDIGFNKYVRKLKSVLFPYHRQSEGFGADFLKYNTVENVYNQGIICMPDSKNGIKSMPLPLYYQRKLFYNLFYVDGKPVWSLKEESKPYKRRYVIQSIENFALKLHNWYQNLDLYIKPSDSTDVYEKIDTLMSGRTWTDLAKYCILYRGRVLSDSQLRDYHLSREIKFDDDDQIDNISRPSFFIDVISNRAECNFLECDGHKLSVSDSNMLSVVFNYRTQQCEKYSQPVHYFDGVVDCESRVVHDYHSKSFKDFDFLLDFYLDSQYLYNLNKQLSYNKLEDVKRNMKCLFSNNLNYFSYLNSQTYV